MAQHASQLAPRGLQVHIRLWQQSGLPSNSLSSTATVDRQHDAVCYLLYSSCSCSVMLWHRCEGWSLLTSWLSDGLVTIIQ
jgi:hypothetical protein